MQVFNNLFRVDEDRIEQRFAACLVHCQQYCSVLLSLNSPGVTYNAEEQYEWQSAINKWCSPCLTRVADKFDKLTICNELGSNIRHVSNLS